MILNKSLLLKCLGGVAACTGVAGLGIFGSQMVTENTSSGDIGGTPPAKVTDDQTITELSALIAKVGLTTCTATDSGSNECTIGESGLNVKQGEGKKEKNKKTDSSQTSGKIKVSKDSNISSYNQGFKFVIEGGDISLTGDGTITKLEQFETYEIKKEDSGTDWYFSRVKEAKDGIKTALGLPEGCSLPDSNTSTCDIESGKINEINFDGKDNTATVTGNVTLTVTKETTPSDDFPFGYKFTFKGKDGEVTLTINGSTITLKQNEGTEFRIKKPATGNNITLEEAWSLTRLLEKVGLSVCTTENNTECTIGSLKVKQGDNKEESKTKDTTDGASTGKIKVSKESTNTNYNKGFKFVIEEGDIKLTSGTGTQINKLEQFETYEIKEESGKWYFSRKDKAGKKIKELLGLPSDCTLVDALNCTDKEISSSNINSLKFDGESSTPSITGTATLTVTKEDSNTEFPFGYKFGFKSSSSGSTATLTINSKTITLKTNEDTEFKIKKGTSGNSLTLAQVWTLETLAKKVNLTCTSDNTCTQNNGQKTNIKHESELGEKTLTTSSSGSGKIKVYTGTEATDYNKGFKFVIEGANVSTDDSNTKLEEFETYEIKEESGKWYFYRKDKAEKGIKKALGLDEISNCNFPTGESNTSTCCNLDADKLKKINFDGKGTDGATVDNSNTSPSLKISITSEQEKTQFPFGYKFTLISDKDITLNSESSKSIKANTNTEFKIKATAAGNGSGARTLSLEKAWNAKSLGEKVGLSCPEPTDNGNKECSLPTNKKINVTFGSGDKKENATIQDDDANKKLKYEEDQEGYNQGIKFYADDDINLDDSKKIDKKGDNGTATYYEIKEDGGTWYLTKKEISNGIGG